MTSILITIQPSVTVIAAETNFYRYDKPGPTELAEYCFTLVGGATEAHSVTVAAESTLAESVAAECAALGFQASTIPLVDDTSATDGSPGEGDGPPTDPDLVVVEDAVEVHRPQGLAESRNNKWSMVLLSVATGGVLAAGLWAVGTTVAQPGLEAVENVASADGAEQPPVETLESETASATPPAPEPEEESVVLEQEGLSVELPAGFQLEADGDMWKAQGNDPDLRLHLAVDELFGLPAEQLLDQVEVDVDADPELSLIKVDQASVEYHQSAPDGSEATWITWVEDGKQVSLGCHTRTAPSMVQRATCTMARESIAYEGPVEGTE